MTVRHIRSLMLMAMLPAIVAAGQAPLVVEVDERRRRPLPPERPSDGPPRVVGQDGGEPEDQLLVRDWQWVAPALNAAFEAGRQSK